MKNSRDITVFALLITSFLTTSCEAVAEIFKAGMGFGAFIVIAMLVAVIFLILRIAGKK